MSMTNQKARALQRIVESPATPFDIGVAVGAGKRVAVQARAVLSGEDEGKMAMGAIGHRLACSLVRDGLVVRRHRAGVSYYTPTPRGRELARGLQ